MVVGSECGVCVRGVYVGVCLKTMCKEYEVGRVCGSVWMM